ncbi:hypothetical protein [Aestuariibius sp. HNIBRBA575]|uniref:hypothetical protein n=1 Tax=Aestuariibius sp. HNIBRBA575 TaxID=3233343 RepID=UPI0034A5C5EF
MSTEWIIAGVMVLSAMLAFGKYLRLLVWSFALMFFGLLAFNVYSGGDGAGALFALGGGLSVVGPVRRILFRSMLG